MPCPESASISPFFLKRQSCNCSPSQPVYPGALCVQGCRHGAQHSKKRARRASAYGVNAIHLYQWVASWSQCVSSNFCWCNWAWALTHWFALKWNACWCHQVEKGWVGLFEFWLVMRHTCCSACFFAIFNSSLKSLNFVKPGYSGKTFKIIRLLAIALIYLASLRTGPFFFYLFYMPWPWCFWSCNCVLSQWAFTHFKTYNPSTKMYVLKGMYKTVVVAKELFMQIRTSGSANCVSTICIFFLKKGVPSMEYCNFVISLYEIFHKTLIVSPQMWYVMKGL